jgi:hypothetical protein
MLYNIVQAYLLTQTMGIMNQKAIYFLFTVITLPLTPTAHRSAARTHARTLAHTHARTLAHTHARTHAHTHARTHAHRRHRPQSRRCHRHSSHLQHTGTPPSCLLHPHTRSRIHPAVAPCRTARICTPHDCTHTQHTRRPRPLGGQMSGRQRRGPPRGSKATGWWR